MTMYQLSLDLEIPAGAISAAAANPFVDARVPTFTDMIALARHDPTLRDRRRYEVISALSCFARLMHQDPAAMPAMVSFYRRQIRRLSPARCGISAKRLANIKSDVMFCMRRYGTAKRRTAMPAVGPAWLPIWHRLDRYQKWALSRFVRWCSASGRAPCAIADSDVEQFHRDLWDSFKDNPNKLTQTVCRTWNKLREAEPALGLPALTVPKYHKPYCLPATSFPVSLQRELEAFCDRLAIVDLFDEDAPPRPLRPETIRLRRFHVLQLASGLVHKGRPPETIASLATLVDPDNLTTSLRFFIDRANGQPTAQIAGLANTAKMLARHWVRVDYPTMDRIGRITGKVRYNQIGMTKKNSEQLRQFGDPENQRRLLFFSELCFAELDKGDDGGIQAVRLAQAAIGAEILLSAPIRISNLAALCLDVHILRSRATEPGTWHLVIPAEETKNHKCIEAIIQPHLVAMLQNYWRDFRPRLAASSCDFVFPAGERHMTATALGKVLSANIYARTGLEVNPHLFRHFVGKLILDEKPGDYGLVQTVLGHRSMKTTLNYYTGEETTAAFRQYEEVVRRVRARLERPEKKS